MGKTLQRQRKKAAAAAAQAPPVAVKPLKRSAATHRVSAALDARQWGEALRALHAMCAAGVAPKLGAVQRWVRAADTSGKETRAAQLLAAIIRASCSGASDSNGDGAAAAPPPPSAAEPPGTVRRFPDWVPPPHDPALDGACETSGSTATVSFSAAAASAASSSEAQAPASATPSFWPLQMAAPAAAAPPAGSAPLIFAASPASTPLAARPPGGGIVRHPVPFVPGAFVLTNVLSHAECEALVALGEAMEYREDVDYASGALGAAANGVAGVSSSGGGAGGKVASAPASAARAAVGGERAAGVVLMADPEALLGPVFERCRPHLPPALDGAELAGINARWRLYRYRPGGTYRPHVDGAWPGSAVVDGKVVHDAFGGRQWSRLTWVLYLNDGFEGGATTFFTAAGDAAGVLEARGVRPVKGNVLCFPHGESAGSLVHEGSAVTAGVKYIVRSEVLYDRPPRGAHPD